jgi:serine/threonine protein kinase
LESEIRALNTVKHPAVLKLLCANASQRFIVTQYHRNGSLNDNLHLYRGNVLAALRAFRSLVDGVVEIHAQGAVHRDIKPANIFVVESGDLVLGDFGIVFFHTGSSETRVTKTVGELVGSHWWMPPWAYMYDRIEMDKVSPSFDIYPLAKVLWSMISGRNGFMREEYEEDDNNLEKIFQNDPLVRLVNGFLATCVVRKEKNCINFALGLRSQVDALISQINERHGDRPDASQPWPCRMCGRGKYRATTTILLGQIPGGAVNDRNPFSVYVCDNVNCRHAELFRTN